MKVLITAASSAPAYKLKNKLSHTDVIMGDFNELPALMIKSMGMLKLPNPASVSYQHEMLTLCLDNQIEIVYAMTRQELGMLNESAQLLKEYNINIADGQIEIQ